MRCPPQSSPFRYLFFTYGPQSKSGSIINPGLSYQHFKSRHIPQSKPLRESPFPSSTCQASGCTFNSRISYQCLGSRLTYQSRMHRDPFSIDHTQEVPLNPGLATSTSRVDTSPSLNFIGTHPIPRVWPNWDPLSLEAFSHPQEAVLTLGPPKGFNWQQRLQTTL